MTKHDEVEWRCVAGASFYQVSSCGRIRSFSPRKSGKEVVQSENRQGYKCIRLVTDSGERKSFRVHRLVAAAFLGGCDLPVNHIDGDKANNHFSNLEYVTARQNTNHRYSEHHKPTGVFHQPTSKKNPWISKIRINGRYVYLGKFKTQEEANAAYIKALNEEGEGGAYVR